MKIKVKQQYYILTVKHNDTIQGAFLWWIKRKNKYCKGFCPKCEYYFRCQEDVAFRKIVEGK